MRLVRVRDPACLALCWLVAIPASTDRRQRDSNRALKRTRHCCHVGRTSFRPHRAERCALRAPHKKIAAQKASSPNWRLFYVRDKQPRTATELSLTIQKKAPSRSQRPFVFEGSGRAGGQVFSVPDSYSLLPALVHPFHAAAVSASRCRGLGLRYLADHRFGCQQQ